MKVVFSILISLIFFPASAQDMTYAEWKDEAKTNMRFLPAYGYREKTAGQIESDSEFIESIMKKHPVPRDASDHMVELGWKYFYRDDIRTAMYRFNQAWLLDSTNENAYWGFGAIYCHFDDNEKALEMYDKGLSMNPNNAKLLTDKATVYFGMLYERMEEDHKEKAIALFNQSLSIDPENMNTLYKLSCLYFLLDDCEKAGTYYEECKKRGGDPITDAYRKALKEKCGID